MSQRRALLKARNICPSCFHDASASPQGMCLSQKGQAGPKGPLPQGCPSGLTPLHSKTLGGKEKNKNKNKRRRRERGTTLFRIGDQNQLHAHPTASTGVWRRAAPVPPTGRAGVPVGHGSGAGVRASRCEAGGRAGPRSRGRRRPGRGGADLGRRPPAAGAAGRAVEGTLGGHRAGRAHPVGLPVCCRLEQSQPGSTRVVEESEGWFFLSGKATAVGGKHSPCYGLRLFSGGMGGSGRRVSASPGLVSPSPGTSPPRAERAGRLP